MAGTLTAVGDALALDYIFSTATLTRPTTWYLALHTGANGGAGAANEIVGNGYARQSVTLSRASNVVSNSSLVTFGPCTGTAWGTVTDVTTWDSLTGGRCLAQGTATASVAYYVGDSATVVISSLTISLN